MKEPDWKLFNKIKEEAIDKFCCNALEEFNDVINNNPNCAHNKYLYLYKLVENKDKEMHLLFDGHSRSKVNLQLFGMRMNSLANEDLIKKLSNELQNSSNPENFK